MRDRLRRAGRVRNSTEHGRGVQLSVGDGRSKSRDKQREQRVP